MQKQHLEIAVEAAQKLLELSENYEEAKALEEALEAGKAVLADTDAAQEEVDAAANAILDQLFRMAKKADVQSLESLIEAAKALAGDKYTAESFAKLQEAIEDAQAVLADQNREETAVADAYAKLVKAIMGLEMKGNKAALKAVIEKAEAMLAQAEAYVPETLEGLEEALTQAKAVYENGNAVQSEVNEAVKALTAKITQARLLGDVDGDGEVSTGDTAAILRASAELGELSEEEKRSGDVNGDRSADTKDAVLILQYAAEKISAF